MPEFARSSRIRRRSHATTDQIPQRIGSHLRGLFQLRTTRLQHPPTGDRRTRLSNPSTTARTHPKLFLSQHLHLHQLPARPSKNHSPQSSPLSSSGILQILKRVEEISPRPSRHDEILHAQTLQNTSPLLRPQMASKQYENHHCSVAQCTLRTPR